MSSESEPFDYDTAAEIRDAWRNVSVGRRAFTSVGGVRAALNALLEARGEDGLWGAGPGARTNIYNTSLAVAALAKSKDPFFHDIVADVSLRYRDQYRSNSKFERLNTRDLSSLIRVLACDSAKDAVLVKRVADTFSERVVHKVESAGASISCALLARALLILGEYAETDPPPELVHSLSGLQRPDDGSWGEGATIFERVSPTALGYVALSSLPSSEPVDRLRATSGAFLEEHVPGIGWSAFAGDIYSFAVVLRAMAMNDSDAGAGVRSIGADHLIALALPAGGWSAGASDTMSVEFTALAILALAEAGETRWVQGAVADDLVRRLASKVERLRSEVVTHRERIDEAASRRCGEVRADRDRLHLENLSLQSDLQQLRDEFAESSEARDRDQRSAALEVARIRSRLVRAERHAERDVEASIRRTQSNRVVSIALQAGLLVIAALLAVFDVSSTIGKWPTLVLAGALGILAIASIVLMNRPTLSRLAPVSGYRIDDRLDRDLLDPSPSLESARRNFIGIMPRLPSGLATELLVRIRQDWQELPPSLFMRRAESLLFQLPLSSVEVGPVLELLQVIARLDPVERVLLADQLLPMIDESGWDS